MNASPRPPPLHGVRARHAVFSDLSSGPGLISVPKSFRYDGERAGLSSSKRKDIRELLHSANMCECSCVVAILFAGSPVPGRGGGGPGVQSNHPKPCLPGLRTTFTRSMCLCNYN